MMKDSWKANREAAITIDDGSHPGYPTGIVMIRIRSFRMGEKAHKTRELAPGLIIDFDQNSQQIQIEILNPSEHFPEEVLKILPHEFVPTKEEPDNGLEDGA